MNRLMIASMCLVGSLGLSACATQGQAGSGYAATAATQIDAPIDRYCVKHTGSRLIVDDDRADKTASFRDACVNAGGRVYTREQIESTGETNIAAALRKLDPSIY